MYDVSREDALRLDIPGEHIFEVIEKSPYDSNLDNFFFGRGMVSLCNRETYLFWN